MSVCTYRTIHKTLPRSIAFVNWISVRFYETDCIIENAKNLVETFLGYNFFFQRQKYVLKYIFQQF